MPRTTTQYVISGTKFYRLASRKLYGYGGNLQNVEKSARRMYWADQGMKLLQRDQAGAEALIVAYLCRHANFRDLFIHGVKPHVFVALHLFRKKWEEKIDELCLDIRPNFDELCSCPIPEIKHQPFWKELDKLIKSSDNWPPSERYYYISKQVCHSSNYGIGAGMFALNALEKSRGKIVLSKKDAEFFLTMYHSLFPEIREWHQEVLAQVKSTRMLYNLLGDPIYFSGDLEAGTVVKEFLSAIAQSTVGCITRRAYTQMQNFIEDAGMPWDMLQDNHDSFLMQFPDDSENEKLVIDISRQFLEVEMTSPKDGTVFNMRSEAATGYNWAPHDKDKNPEGLQEVK